MVNYPKNSCCASQVVALLYTQVGYPEKNNANNLDGFGGAGNGNYTKYARDLYKAGFFNGNKQGHEWCTTMLPWAVLQVCNGDAKKAKYIVCQDRPGWDCGAGCGFASDYYKALGLWSDQPRVGDSVYFNDYAHTGIVAEVRDGTIVTIEGNYDNKVAVNSYRIGDSRIDGYGHPRYDPEPPEVSFAEAVQSEVQKQTKTLCDKLSKTENNLSGIQERLDKLSESKVYDTIESLPDWAKEPISRLVENGLLRGVAFGKLGLTKDQLRIFTVLGRAEMAKEASSAEGGKEDA